VSFIAPHDPDYAKRIKQGLPRDPAYDAFIERFRLEYGISPRQFSPVPWAGRGARARRRV
jgi:hypothetical protein